MDCSTGVTSNFFITDGSQEDRKNPTPAPQSNSVIPELMKKVCGFCQKEGPGVLSLCGGCKSIRYCGANCQRSHWPTHKVACQKLKIQASSESTAPLCPVGGDIAPSNNPLDFPIRCRDKGLLRPDQLAKLRQKGYQGLKEVNLSQVIASKGYNEALKYIWTEDNYSDRIRALTPFAKNGHPLFMLELSQAYALCAVAEARKNNKPVVPLNRVYGESMAEKDTLCDEYLAREHLLTYEKAEVYDNEMMTTVDFDRPRVSLLGAMALLGASNVFKIMPPSAFEQEVPLVAGPGRRSLEENIRQLNTEFTDGLYIRTFSDQQFEYDKVISQKIACEQDPSKSDNTYWSSASTVQAGLRNKLWEGEFDDSCGLAISSQATLGGWNRRDMETENVPATVTNDDEIKNYFPNRFPSADFSAILDDIGKEEDASWELIEQILNKPSGSAKNKDIEIATNFVLERMDPKHIEHNNLLSKLPDNYKSSFTLAEVQQRMRELAKEKRIQEHNEAKIHYRPNDILGVCVANNPGSLAKGAQLQKQLAASGIAVPLVTFEENKGAIRIYNQASQVPPDLPAILTM